MSGFVEVVDAEKKEVNAISSTSLLGVSHLTPLSRSLEIEKVLGIGA